MSSAQSDCLLNYNKDPANKLAASGLSRHTAVVVRFDRILIEKACCVSEG